MARVLASYRWAGPMSRAQWTESTDDHDASQTMDRTQRTEIKETNQRLAPRGRYNESTQRTGSKGRIKQSPQRFASASGIGEDPRNRITEPEPHQCTEPPAKLVKESGGSPSLSRSD